MPVTSLLSWFRRAPQVSPERARRRAARGAAYLDDVDPGWHRRLDLGALALEDGAGCVLGQLHGTFRRGLGRARLFCPGSAPRASLSPVAHGFHCVHAGDEETEARDYELLDEAWQEEVRQRQEADRRERPEEPPKAPRQRARLSQRPNAATEEATPAVPA
ncbi:MAG: hypothetical protein BRD48_07000 [Bacteroidetes bacterium QS_9_68_14]|nr:MAG: hypothetical protein BRD48_07000 [Bacteroidetes bacterium QS_9_68_14]